MNKPFSKEFSLYRKQYYFTKEVYKERGLKINGIVVLFHLWDNVNNKNAEFTRTITTKASKYIISENWYFAGLLNLVQKGYLEKLSRNHYKFTSLAFKFIEAWEAVEV